MKKREWMIMLLLGCMTLGGCAKEQASMTDNGMAALMQQDYRGAISCFEQSILGEENLEENYRGLGLAYMGIGEYEDAVAAFENALAEAGMFPGDLEYDINYYMAIAYYKMEEYDAAISVYDTIIDMRPKDTNAYFLRGSMKLYLQDVDGAVADFDQAVSIGSNDYSLYLDVYDCLKEHGYEAQAQGYLDQILLADSKNFSEYDKGRLAYYNGEYQKACNYLEHVRQNGEADVKLIMLLGECYKLQGFYEYAAVVYDAYVSTNPNPEIYNQMGLCYVEQGNYAAALSAFQSGIAIKENNTCLQTLKLNEIACYEYMHEFDLAAQCMEEYLGMYPATEELQKEYAFLTTR